MNKPEVDCLVVNGYERGATKDSQKFVGILSGIDVFMCRSYGKSLGSHSI